MLLGPLGMFLVSTCVDLLSCEGFALTCYNMFNTFSTVLKTHQLCLLGGSLEVRQKELTSAFASVTE